MTETIEQISQHVDARKAEKLEADVQMRLNADARKAEKLEADVQMRLNADARKAEKANFDAVTASGAKKVAKGEIILKNLDLKSENFNKIGK